MSSLDQFVVWAWLMPRTMAHIVLRGPSVNIYND
jgi:hypothetical protein